MEPMEPRLARQEYGYLLTPMYLKMLELEHPKYPKLSHLSMVSHIIFIHVHWIIILHV